MTEIDLKSRIVVTLDGLAGTGKTTLARELAKRLNFQHLNSGILYRSIAHVVLDRSIKILTNKSLQALLSSVTISVKRANNGHPVVIVSDEGQLTYEDLQSEQISTVASTIATFPSVREFLLPVQRDAFPGIPLVAEGRDMGTVVFPHSQLKIYVEVNQDVRAVRRFAQLKEAGMIDHNEPISTAQNRIKSEILARDIRDQERLLAPCIPAPDAVIFDNAVVSLTQAVDELYHLASRTLTALS